MSKGEFILLSHCNLLRNLYNFLFSSILSFHVSKIMLNQERMQVLINNKQFDFCSILVKDVSPAATMILPFIFLC